MKGFHGSLSACLVAVTALARCANAIQLEVNLPFDCQSEPNFRKAIQMQCNFTGMSSREVSISSGALPTSLRVLRITNCNALKIAENAFSRLSKLKNIRLEDVGFLRIAKSNWSQRVWSGDMNITISRISVLHLDTDAFSGWPQPGPSINITEVDRCIISRSTIGPNSTVQTLVLRRVQNLTMSTESLLGNMNRLILRNVTVGARCRSISIGGRVGSMFMHFVNIAHVSSGCMYAGKGWGSLEVRSSFLGTIHPFGINGNISSVVIEDSKIGLVTLQGISLETSAFVVKSTRVDELESGGLEVRFSQVASLLVTSVGILRDSAFGRLKPQDGHQATFIINHLTVDRAENGSLTFPERAQITLLDILLPEACGCDIYREVQRLVGIDAVPHQATEAQRSAVRQVVGQSRCSHGTDTPTLREYLRDYCSWCGESDAVSCSPPREPRPSAGVWEVAVAGPALVIALLLLLMTVSVAVMLVKRRRSHPPARTCSQCTQRRERLRKRHENHQYALEPALGVQTRSVDEALESIRNEERYATLTTESSLCSGSHPIPPPKNEYSELLPRPPSAIYCEMASVLVRGLPHVAESREDTLRSSAGEWPSREEPVPQTEPVYNIILPRPPSSVDGEGANQIKSDPEERAILPRPRSSVNEELTSL